MGQQVYSNYVVMCRITDNRSAIPPSTQLISSVKVINHGPVEIHKAPKTHTHIHIPYQVQREGEKQF